MSIPPINSGRVKALYLQIVDALEEQIQSGKIPVGRRLLPERTLAVQMRVSRTTVTTAYRELEARGLIRGFVGRGTLVVAAPRQRAKFAFPLSQRSASVSSIAGEFGYDLIHRTGVFPFDTGWQDPSMYPIEELNASLRDMIHAASVELYLPSRPEGDWRLRGAVCRLLRARGMRISPEDILITGGAQQGLALVARAFLEPQDVVLTEAPTFVGALATFSWAGVRVIGVPVDDHGVRCELIEELITRHRPKLLYVMPNFHNPTGTLLSHHRRLQLLELANRYRVPILESDLYSDIYFKDPPPPPLKSLDESNMVMYQGSFSKIGGPGLRIAWIVAGAGAREGLLAAKSVENLHVPALTQQLVARFLSSAQFERHLAKLRAESLRRRNLFVTLLREHCPLLEFKIPAGGYYIWARLPAPLTAEQLVSAAEAHHVALRPGSRVLGGRDFVRLTFVSVEPKRIEDGIRRLGAALDEVRSAANKRPTRGPAFAAVPRQ